MGNPFLLSLALLSVCCRGTGIHSEVLQQRDLGSRNNCSVVCTPHPTPQVSDRWKLYQALSEQCALLFTMFSILSLPSCSQHLSPRFTHL